MSDFVVHSGERDADSFARHYGVDVAEVHFCDGNATTVLLADGRSGAGTCLGCGTPKCMEKDDGELTLLGALDAFPGDPSLEVCPTRAIRWEPKHSAATVDEGACIGCGLCVIRCPYGAVRLSDKGTAVVETTDPERLAINGPTSRHHPEAKRIGRIAAMDSSAAANLPANVGALDDSRTLLLIRNLLNEVGLPARTRRRGDTNMRIDAVGFSPSGRPFVAEIETGNAVLESPRALMEDVAILHSRYGYDVRDVDPISIILAFPNVRSEYYQVIRDIEKVLNLRCRTVTVGALVSLIWNCSKIDGFDGSAFAIGADRADLAQFLGLQEANTSEPYPGAFRPAK